MLETCPQAQREHIAKAGRIHGTYRGVGRHEGQVGGEVVDRVDAPAQIVEFRIAQAESSCADVPDHDPDARLERVVPDLGVLQGGAYSRKAVLDAVRADQAVHDEAVVLPQERAQEKPAHQPGGAGQQHLPEGVRRHRFGRRFLRDGGVNEAAQAVEVAAALHRHSADEGRYRFRIGE